MVTLGGHKLGRGKVGCFTLPVSWSACSGASSAYDGSVICTQLTPACLFSMGTEVGQLECR